MLLLWTSSCAAMPFQPVNHAINYTVIQYQTKSCDSALRCPELIMMDSVALLASITMRVFKAYWILKGCEYEKRLIELGILTMYHLRDNTGGHYDVLSVDSRRL